jgi:AraC family transcriptional regulator of arabinose operon
MEYRAMPLPRAESPQPPSQPITIGSFSCKRRHFAWRSNGTGDWQILYTESGSGRFGTRKGDLQSKKGDLVLLCPRTPHDYGASSPNRSWKVRWAHFIPDDRWLPWLRWPEFSPGVLRLELNDLQLHGTMVERFTVMERYSRRPDRHGEALAQTVLQEILLHCNARNPHMQESSMDIRIRKIVESMAGSLGQRIKLEEMAESCGLSASRFSHLFQKEVGKSPLHYLEDRRMLRARQMLERTGHSISQIAYDLGYDDPLYFSKRFKVYTGFSPRDFRRKPSVEARLL